MQDPGDLKTGDYVSYWRGMRIGDGPIDHGYVIGFPPYSREDRGVVMLATEDAWGMPINVGHLTLITRDHDVSAWRQRYQDKFGWTLYD